MAAKLKLSQRRVHWLNWRIVVPTRAQIEPNLRTVKPPYTIAAKMLLISGRMRSCAPKIERHNFPHRSLCFQCLLHWLNHVRQLRCTSRVSPPTKLSNVARLKIKLTSGRRMPSCWAAKRAQMSPDSTSVCRSAERSWVHVRTPGPPVYRCGCCVCVCDFSCLRRRKW